YDAAGAWKKFPQAQKRGMERTFLPGIRPQFKNGLRVTDAPTMEVVEMVLVGK
ncbi:hypothetical protein KI387_035822, partial [Taxus chinensis]